MGKHFYHKTVNRIKAYISYPIAQILSFFLQIDNSKYLCISMAGTGYGDSVKCISDCLKENDSQAKIIWAFLPEYYGKIKCDDTYVPLYSIRYYINALTSKYIISNTRMNQRMLHKRKGQVYIQTWHGTALKRLGFDIKRKRNVWKRLLLPSVFDFDMKNIDIMISGSTFMSRIYREKFGFKGQICEVGMPRNDIFFHDNANIIVKVKNYFHIPHRTKIILYAPTFRNDGLFTYYDIDYRTLLKVCEEKTGQKYVFVTRLHPNIRYKERELDQLFGPEVINASSYPDMQELLYATDFLVTDYSSSMFDFMLSHKPVLLYTPDKDSYSNGFYFKIEDLPFIHINDNSEIEQQLYTFDELAYSEKISAFLKKIGNKETGEASIKVYQLIQVLKKDEN